MKLRQILLLILVIVIVVPIGLVARQYLATPERDHPSVPAQDAAAQIAQGRYLVRAGDCMACHTARGGREYAGGRAIPTPFGAIYAPNITPDKATGIGDWSADDFWRALHNGRGKDGRFLYPAFPYPNYTRVTRADSDAMYAYLRTVEAVNQPNRDHELRFPYNQRILLAGWRALYFTPGVQTPEPKRSTQWNRGAYLVQGLGHCAACHTARNALGATANAADLAGGMIPMLNWYASSLTSDVGSGLGHWEEKHIADLLKTGVSERGAVFGPMAEVVSQSLQYLSDSDIAAMATYLKSLPRSGKPLEADVFKIAPQEVEALVAQGGRIYEKQCAECHQANGQGVGRVYPPLAGNRSLVAPSAINPIRIVLNGGFPPSTGGNPRPYGMPPFGPDLSDNEVAAVVTYIRQAWGNDGSPVSPAEVTRFRGAPVE